MKKHSFLSVLLLTVLILGGCKKGGSGADEPEPAVTPVGSNDGTAVTKNIGSTGGTIVSNDGEVEVIIPSGALAANTDITIQPITNQAPNGRRKAYRLTPDGQQFSKDITIRFHYTEEDASMTSPEYMQAAFQKSDGTWQAIDKVTNDVGGKTISALVNHFTDFTAFDILRIVPPARHLRKNATGEFQISWAGMTTGNLVTFGAAAIRDNPVWKVNGTTGGNSTYGTIRATAPAVAIYTAPAAEPPTNPVDISVEVNMPFTVDGQRFNRGILLAKAHIIGAQYRLDLEFTGESAVGYGEVYSVKDNVRMGINLSGSEGTVEGAINVPPTFTKTGSSTSCTSSFLSEGTGPINLRDIDAIGVTRSALTGDVYVFFDSDAGVVPAKLQMSCPPTPPQTSDFLPWNSSGAVLTFKDNGLLQTIQMTSTSNLRLTLTATPIQ